ncbi:hypothetical protein QVD17_05235 [Tagetes erecta]|uniref:Uncharacterized protein n=1 Tax=Tagetes erecta TaxID=13708 RepID=A0AAD8LDF2_TARER|nr:hypothetical protein QVD17_05235 [Tagetes erecta]
MAVWVAECNYRNTLLRLVYILYTRLIPACSRSPKMILVIDLKFQVKDDDVFGACMLVTVKNPTEKITTSEVVFDWLTMKNAELNMELEMERNK